VTEPAVAEPAAAPPEVGLVAPEAASWKTPTNSWTNLALVVPVFVAYHLGVISMPVRNAADWVTVWLCELARDQLGFYALLTGGLGLGLVGVLALLGRGQAFQLWRLGLVLLEGAAYAVAMAALATYVVGELRLGPGSGGGGESGPWLGIDWAKLRAGVVMALGAGLYEELAFRVALYGAPALLLRWLVPGPVRSALLRVVWAVVAAAIFSGWHYVGPMSDPFELRSFVFRWVCGFAFTAIYAFRGLAPAVWTHVLYDVWALAAAAQ
jgi:hypothetical protein